MNQPALSSAPPLDPTASSRSEEDLYALAGKTIVRSIRLPRPDSSTGKSSLLDEAYDAFCELRKAGHSVDPDDFCARYPTVQHSLARLILAHRFLEENSELVDEPVSSDWPLVGEALAGFHLKRELGHGAFARVYQATEPELGNRQVAIKVSPQGTSEAATLGRINHPNIVPVYSVKEDPGTGFSIICMPYLGCATLNNVLDHVHGQSRRVDKASVILEAVRDPSLPDPPTAPALLSHGSYADGVRWLALGMAEALAFIHARGICHRDLKPSNILVRPNGTPMLLDFNLSSDAELPNIRLGGTLLYMAPEQLRATDRNKPRDPKALDARADVFSFGVILYELLTGKHPFGPLPLKANAQELRAFLLEKHQKGFRAIRELNSQVEGSLARVVEACLAHEPKDRPASAANIVALLRRALTPLRRAGRWLLNHRKTAAAMLGVLLTTTAAAGYQVFIRPPEHVVQFNRSEQAFKAGDFQEALALLDQSMPNHPDQAGVCYARGRIYKKMAECEADPRKSIDRLNDAYHNFLQSDRHRPSEKAKAAVATCLHRTGSPKKALEWYQDLKSDAIIPAALHNNLGAIYFDGKGDLDPQLIKAQENIDKALQLDPNLTAAHHNMALIFFQKALWTKNTYGHNQETQDWLEKGIGAMRRALQLGPITGELNYDAAVLCAVAARKDAVWKDPALAYLKNALDLGVNPKRLNDYFLMSLATEPAFLAMKQRPHAPNPAAKAVRVVDLIRE